VILGLPGLDLMPGLKIKQFGQGAAFRRVKMLLHQAECDARPLRQLSGERHCGVEQFALRDDQVGYA
jgi:hypothetical protein